MRSSGARIDGSLHEDVEKGEGRIVGSAFDEIPQRLEAERRKNTKPNKGRVIYLSSSLLWSNLIFSMRYRIVVAHTNSAISTRDV